MITTVVLLSLAYGYLNYLIWIKTRSIPLFFIQIIFYFYTFHVYWVVLLNHYNVPIGLDYIMDYPFLASLNETMLLSLVHYMAFSFLFFAVILFGIAIFQRERLTRDQCVINFRSLLFVGIILCVLASSFWLKDLVRVFSSGLSAYSIYKSGADFGVLYPVLRLLFDLSSSMIFLAFFSSLAVPKKTGIRRNEMSRSFFVSVVMVVVLYAVLMSFGDKSSLFFGLLFSLSIVLANQATFKWRWACIMLVSVVLIDTISILRHNPVGVGLVGLLISTVSHMAFHGEIVSGLSQYILLNSNVALYGGKSASFLANILIPRFIYPYRMEDPYAYFAFQSGLPSDTGWGIHYATDWYMNFEVGGMLGGAVLLGYLCYYLYRKSLQSHRWLFIFSGFVASLPLSIRAGLAGMKNMAVGMFLGLIVYYIACRKVMIK